jgi:hypothetical protein
MTTTKLFGVTPCEVRRHRRTERDRVRRARRASLRGAVALGAALLLGVGGAACAKARAQTVPDGPPLLVPAPPQRVLAPVEALVIPEVAAEPAPVPAAAAPRREPARPVIASGPRPTPPAPEAPAALGRAGDLRAGSASTAVTEPDVRAMLERAARDRAGANLRRLSAAGRSQYEQSERFTAQAEQALRDRNLIFAATLAEKAAALALELVGR